MKNNSQMWDSKCSASFENQPKNANIGGYYGSVAHSISEFDFTLS